EKSPLIEAPFDGFITTVNVEGGDEVLTGTVAVQLADPNKFEADIMVSEMDILQVKLGGEAWVQVDAMSGLTLPAEVIHISPTSTIQSGVVNYEVKVEVKSLETVMHKRQATISEDFQLREGLTVTVTILVDERTDVLLVPSNAITRRGMEAYIQVVKGDTTEERAVETGVSDWQFTEVIAGLSAGEQVVVPKNTSPTTSTLQPRGPMPFSPPH
ncbi:MAG: HlyD family efflux transporter periplasmic adaptor subunit, partial [Dehalococcoidales bacterium]